MNDNEEVDPETELEDLLKELQPRLQDLIKRGFTNIAIQSLKNADQLDNDVIGDISYSSKHTQVNLTSLKLANPLSFHIQTIALDVKSMKLNLRCSLGEVTLRGLYSAYNENLYNLLPVMSEGHMVMKLSNVYTDLEVGLEVKDDALALINPYVTVIHDEIIVQLSWPAPLKNGEYEFKTTEQIAKHTDDLPITIALCQPISALLRRRLLQHLGVVIKTIPLVSEFFGSKDTIIDLYMNKLSQLAVYGNKVIDTVLMHVRMTLYQSQREVLQLPPMLATFVHKVGLLSFVGKLETDTGWIKNLATINRISDVSVTPYCMSYKFHVTLSFKDLKIGFDEYRIKLPGGTGGPNGRILVSIGENLLHLAITTGHTEWQPYSQLDDLKIDCFDQLDLHITGLGELSWISNKANAWISGYLNAVVAKSIENQIKAELHKAFSLINLWKVS